MPDPAVYIAGVGLSPWSWPRTSLPLTKTKSAIRQLAISAGTKALLDAGLSYDYVDLAISGGGSDLRGDNDVFYTFGKTGIPIHEVDNDSCVYAANHFIKTGSAHCVLLIGLDQSAAVGIILASEAFLSRHPYLKDAAARIRACALGTSAKASPRVRSVVQEAFRQANVSSSDIQLVESNAKSALGDLGLSKNVQTWSSTTRLSGLCELVWLLRGWTNSDDSSIKTCLQYTISPNGTTTATILSRADGKPAPNFEEVKHKNDGRDRLGYNPASQTKDIAMEDWEAVKSRAEFSDERAADKVHFRRKGGDRAALAKL